MGQKIKLKKIRDQVVVVTGASSGIGRATARLAAKRGAKVVLAARDEPSLREARSEIERQGGTAHHVVADVSDPSQVENVAEVAQRTYGGLDTWVNNAGVTIFGRIQDVSREDARRLFDVNYWGVVYGSLTAMRHMGTRSGSVINVGSILSRRSLPLQGHYSASKHAVKGFTEALRMEIEHDELPIALTLIDPGSIATGFVEHAKNYLPRRPTLPSPLYSPEVVARAIIECAQRPVRHLSVGASGPLVSAANGAPAITERVLSRAAYATQQTEHPADDGESALHHPMFGTGKEQVDFGRHVRRSSLYTKAVLRPGRALVTATAMGVGLLWVAARLRSATWIGR
jgi:NAD(P)-dependent dehydrogenase (short-subunit alcohol dehydrogenase family)